MELGKEVELDFKFEKGKMVVSVTYDGKGVDSTISIMMEAEYFMDKLADAIPGEIDNTIINLLKAALIK